jgi:lipopolysaccharide exporter
VNLKKGTIALIAGWAVQLLAGYALNRFLARTFDLAAFGVYGLVMTLLLWIEILVITGIPTAVQKFVAARPAGAGSILSAAARLELGLAIALSASLFLAAPGLAALFRNPELSLYLRLVALNLPFYGFFHLFAAFQNGLRRFDLQALCTAAYGAFKLGFVAGAVAIRPTLTSAFVGNIFGSVASLILAAALAGNRWREKPSGGRELARFAVPALLYFMMVQLILSIDLWLVNYHVGGAAGGYYFAAGNVARIPFYLLSGLSATVLPTISHALEEAGGGDRVRSLVAAAMRFLFLLVAPVLAFLGAYSKPMLALLFSGAYEPAAGALRVLAAAMSVLAFGTLFLTVINADGRPAVSFRIAAVTAGLDAVLNGVFVPRFGLMGAAFSTFAAVTAGTAWAVADVLGRFRVRVPAASLAKIALAACIPAGFGFLVPVRGLAVLPAGLAGFAAYGAVLFAIGEIRKQELEALFWKKKNPEPVPVPSDTASP